MSLSTTAETPIGPVDLVAERAALGTALEDAVLRVLKSGQYILGPEVEAFEREFAALHGVAHGIAVANGTDALAVALKALGVEPGDHVVTSPFTFFASAGVVAWIGARPILADVELETGLLDPKLAERAIDARTRCILPVHLYGQMADMRAFRALADAKRVGLLEDAAQSHLAKRDGVACGALGDAAAFSFYPTKNLGACGEAGMVLTQNDALAARLRRVREHGSPVRYTHAEIGTNSRMQAFQGAILRAKLPHLERWTARRREIAARYDEAFAGSRDVTPLVRVARSEHVYHQYTVRLRSASREKALAALAARKIFAQVHYPSPVHLQEAARPWGYSMGDFQNAETLAREVACLPVHPFLTNSDVDRVAENVLAAAAGRI